MQSALTSVSLDQWMEKLSTWKTATRELVRLWLVNELGCQRDLANHLGLSDRAIRKHVAKLREDGDLPPLDASDGRGRNHSQKQELSSYSSPVPIASYPSAVMPEEEEEEEEEATLNLPTAAELMARVLNLEAENASLREQLEASHTAQLEAKPIELSLVAPVAAPAPPADVADLTKKMERLQKRLKDRDRRIKNLQRLVPKTQITNLPLLEPWEETDEERLRFFPTDAQTRAGLGDKPTKYRPDEFFPSEAVTEAVDAVNSMLYRSLGTYNVDEVKALARRTRGIAQRLQDEFFNRSEGCSQDTINPIAASQHWRAEGEVIDVDQLTIDV